MVVFESSNSDLINTDNNDYSDVFMRDIASNDTVRISQTSDGIEGDNDSRNPAVSQNARIISFFTQSGNLGGTTDSSFSIMVYDRSNSILEVVSVDENNNPLFVITEKSSVSNSGRYITYSYKDGLIGLAGDEDREDDVVIYDRNTGNTQIVSVNKLGQQVSDQMLMNDRATQVVEDFFVSPPLVGVFFSSSNPIGLTAVPHHPDNRELFLFQQGGPDVNLNIQIVCLGQVTGTSGINCTSSCDASFELGFDLSLIANPATDSEFLGWSVEFGGCDLAAQNPCEIFMDRSKTVTAYFSDNDQLFVASFVNSQLLPANRASIWQISSIFSFAI